MRRLPPVLLAMMFGALSAGPAMAAGTTAIAQGEAQAQVVQPLIVTRESDLEFGAVFADADAGAVTVSRGSQARYSGGARPACAGDACYSAHAARFSVQGEPGRAYVISVPGRITANGTATEGSSQAAPALSVSGITVSSASRPAGGPAGILDADGQDRFEVGGTLELPANLPPASYKATIPVIVTYG